MPRAKSRLPIAERERLAATHRSIFKLAVPECRSARDVFPALSGRASHAQLNDWWCGATRLPRWAWEELRRVALDRMAAAFDAAAPGAGRAAGWRNLTAWKAKHARDEDKKKEAADLDRLLNPDRGED